MATQASAVFHCWRARCLAIESCLADVLASAAQGKLAMVKHAGCVPQCAIAFENTHVASTDTPA